MVDKASQIPPAKPEAWDSVSGSKPPCPSGIMILTPVQLKLPPLSHFLAPHDQLLSKLPPDSFPVIIFFLRFFTHGKTISWGSPNPFRLANPGNVKLRESSGKAGGLPLGFRNLTMTSEMGSRAS
jgi:hypothetical protein